MKRKQTSKHWLKEHDDFLRKNYKKRCDRDLGQILGVTGNAVLKRRLRIGLKRPSGQRYFQQSYVIERLKKGVNQWGEPRHGGRKDRKGEA